MKPLATLTVLLALAGAALAQTPAPCPKELGEGVECWSGADVNGAYYWIARPKTWNGVLIVHAHGGPRLSAPGPNSPVEDLVRFAVLVREGYAWAGSSYRRGGYGVRMAVEDTEHARRVFVDRFGAPRRTLAHGQSWGGNVAAKLNETLAATPDGVPIYDGVLLTSGVLAGGTHGYDFRLDLRVVYQYYCHNHPRPEEPQYPLWMGLPAGAAMTRKELEARVNECTGIQKPAAARNAAEQQNLANILAVVRVPDKTLVAHLAWGTFLFRDLVQLRLGGRNPFGNVGVAYVGSTDDAALDRGVQRYAADPAAVAQLADDSDLSGALRVPTVTLHAIHDPTAFVEQESRYRDAVLAAGKGDLLVQTFVDESKHSFLTAPEYPAVLQALVDWVDTGQRPTPAGIAASCERYRKAYGGRCTFVPDFQPQPFASRFYPRTPAGK